MGADATEDARSALAGALPAYELGDELGRGACGIVHAALHRQLDRQVAIKQLAPGIGPDSEIGARFLTEARVLASLDHPHVVRVYDYVEARDVRVLIMERVSGGTVKDRLRRGGLSAPEACAVVVAACRGLHYAHGRGVLHRDVKPQNLLLSEEGVVKVADFGIAKVVAGTANVATRTGVLLGTPAYMAPEQITGGPITEAVDVYAAGTMLYELLCGALPFPSLGDPLAELHERVHGDPVPLLQRAPDLPATLVEIVACALRRERAERFASAADLAEAVMQAARREWGTDWMTVAAAPPDMHVDLAGTIAATVIGGPPPAAAAAELVDRDSEREQLRRAVRAARSGAGEALLVEGAAGVGKSSLLAQVAIFAEAAGLRVLRARGGEMERDYPYGAVRQLLEREARRLAHETDGLRGAAALAGGVLGVTVVDDDAPEDDEREFATCHGLYWLLCELADRVPLLLVVDDAHQLDPPSLRFLLYLVRRLAGLRLSVIIAARTGEGEQAPSALGHLAAEGSVQKLLPGPVSATGVEAMIRRRLGADPAPELVSACLEVTGGNAFLVEQLLVAAADERPGAGTAAADRLRDLVSDAVTRSVLERLERQPREVGRLARAVAVLGDDVALRDAADLAGIDPFVAADHADRLTEQGVLRPGVPLGFLHPLLRTTVLDGMDPDVRAGARRRAAEVLQTNGAPAAAVAAQLFELAPAGDPSVVARLRAAAGEALAQGAADIATRQLRRALDEPPASAERGAVLAELGHAALLAGDPSAAAVALDESLELAKDPAERLIREIHAFGAHFGAEGRLDPDEIMGIVARVERLGGAPDRRTQALFAEVVAAATNVPQLLPELGMHLAPYEDAPGDSAGERMMLAALSRVACQRGDSARQAADLARRALVGRVMLAEQGAEAVSFYTAVFTVIDADELGLAEKHLAAAMDLARRRGSELGYAAASGFRGVVAFQRGDVRAAEEHAAAAMETGCLHGILVPIVGACLVRARLAAGDNVGAAEVIAPIGDADLPDLAPFNHLVLARGQVRFARGDIEGALADMRTVLARAPQVVRCSRILPWRALAVPVLLAAGEADAAVAVAAEDVAAAVTWGTLGAHGAALLGQAPTADVEGRLGLLDQAIALLGLSPARLDLATAHVLRAETLATLGEAAGACDAATTAAHLAETCGAGALRQRAEQVLGLERPAAAPAVAALTPGERRVAHLAAQGMSDRSIAETLFATPRTVQKQLEAVCLKLGLEDRSQITTPR